MDIRKSKYSKFVFWVIVLVGAIPPLVMIDVGTVFHPGTLFLLVWNDIPFIVLAFLVKSHLDRIKNQSPQVYIQRISKIIGAGIAVFGTVFFIHLIIWIEVFSNSPGSSTAGLVLLFIPFYALILMPIGYVCGWLAGRLILWIKKKRGTLPKVAP